MKNYGGFRLNENSWKILKFYKNKGQSYTTTIEKAINLYQTKQNGEKNCLNNEKDNCLNNKLN